MKKTKIKNLRFRRFIVLSFVFLFFGLLTNEGVSLAILDKDTDSKVKLIMHGLNKFHRQFGHYPEKLEEIAEKKFLRPVPLDPNTKKPFTYETKKENGKVVYFEIKTLQNIGQEEKIFKAKQK